MADLGEHSKKEIAALVGAGLVLLVLALLMSRAGLAAYNAAPLALGLLILVAGYRFGPVVSWMVGLGGGLVTVVLFQTHGIEWDIFVISLVTGLVCALFPIPWMERHQLAEKEFEQARQPLEEQRQKLQDELKEMKVQVREAEKHSRETDALYHVGREISKVLYLEDMITFSSQSIQDALTGLVEERDKEQFSFTLLVAQSELESGYEAAASWNMPPEAGESLAASMGKGQVGEWLAQRGEPRRIFPIASQIELKGIAAPPGSRGMASLPLLIRGEVIGLILVFDAAGAMDEYLFNSLKILSSQIAIGLEKARLYDQVQKLSITDGLTGLFVHRYFQERLDEEIRRAERYSEPLAFLMFDIDHFKKYNDTYGHLVGDAVLKQVAKILRDQMDKTDIVSRYGGEEFAVILANQNKSQAEVKAEKARAAIANAKFEFEGAAGNVTISGGIAVYPGDAMTKKGLVDRADQALYKAKKAGRNRILSSSSM